MLAFGRKACLAHSEPVYRGLGAARKRKRGRSPNVIRTVTGDVDTIRGRILPHEHLQIDLSAQKGPANRLGKEEEQDVVDDLKKAKQYGLAAITDLSAPGW